MRTPISKQRRTNRRLRKLHALRKVDTRTTRMGHMRCLQATSTVMPIIQTDLTSCRKPVRQKGTRTIQMDLTSFPVVKTGE